MLRSDSSLNQMQHIDRLNCALLLLVSLRQSQVCTVIAGEFQAVSSGHCCSGSKEWYNCMVRNGENSMLVTWVRMWVLTIMGDTDCGTDCILRI